MDTQGKAARFKLRTQTQQEAIELHFAQNQCLWVIKEPTLIPMKPAPKMQKDGLIQQAAACSIMDISAQTWVPR